MNIKNIISVSGMPGLFKVIAQTRSGFVVESLLDKKRIPVFSSNKISTLTDISIYTTGEDMPLKDVLQKIFEKENGNACIDQKLPEAELLAYMETVMPEYDKERVRISDIKKLFTWYNMMQKAGGILDAAEEEDTEEATDLTTDAAKNKTAKPVKDTVNKPIKTSGAKAKATQGVRKTGTA